jgi:3',5'-nucleoside bisphosphate phosphatase
MKTYRADLHIHTVLSPCGDLEMSPGNIIAEAAQKKLDIIGITDHNSTKHCKLAKEFGEQSGIYVLCGAEITTREEVHCLVFFEEEKSLGEFQDFIDLHLPDFPNDVNKFGYQVVVDKDENIIEEEERLLIVALDSGIDEVERKVHELNGLFIPAHINRMSNSIISQLGFIPSGLNFDALEITYFSGAGRLREKYGIAQEITLLRDSDAHNIENIGLGFSEFEILNPTFGEIRMALKNQGGRKVRI